MARRGAEKAPSLRQLEIELKRAERKSVWTARTAQDVFGQAWRAAKNASKRPAVSRRAAFGRRHIPLAWELFKLTAAPLSKADTPSECLDQNEGGGLAQISSYELLSAGGYDICKVDSLRCARISACIFLLLLFQSLSVKLAK
jgi:hypothetical protein